MKDIEVCFEKQFGRKDEIKSFSVPGRVELGGNHTDHNGGIVLAACPDLCTRAVGALNGSGTVNVFSEGFGLLSVDLNNIVGGEGSEALVAGVCDYFKKKGGKTGGMDLYVRSEIPSGAGLASSASFSVLVAKAMAEFYTKKGTSKYFLACAAQYAEREFYKKPCGMLDQLACAYARTVKIDFKKGARVEEIAAEGVFDGYEIMLVNVGASHSGLIGEYASVPQEMKLAAQAIGKERLCGVSRKKIVKNADAIRRSAGDRAFLRALHFADECERAKAEAEAIETKDIKTFLRLVRESGRSSSEYLQNIIPTGETKNQPAAIALNIAQNVLGDEGACRIHGGGFGGTVLCIAPLYLGGRLRKEMKAVFGKNCIIDLKIS